MYDAPSSGAAVGRFEIVMNHNDNNTVTLGVRLAQARDLLAELEVEARTLGIRIDDAPANLIGQSDDAFENYADYLMERYYSWNCKVLELEDHLSDGPTTPQMRAARQLGRRCHAWYEQHKVSRFCMGLPWLGEPAFQELLTKALAVHKASPGARKWLRESMGFLV